MSGLPVVGVVDMDFVEVVQFLYDELYLIQHCSEINNIDIRVIFWVIHVEPRLHLMVMTQRGNRLLILVPCPGSHSRVFLH